MFSLKSRVCNIVFPPAIDASTQWRRHIVSRRSLFPVPNTFENYEKNPIPMNYAFRDDDAEAEKELRSERRKIQHSRRQAQQHLNSMLSNLSTGKDLEVEDVEDAIVNEYANETDTTSNDHADQSLSLDEDDSANVLLTEDETNLLAGVSSAVPNDSDMKVCEYATGIIEDAKKRATYSESDTALGDHKMDPPKVRFTATYNILDGKGGPNESLQSKLEQLLVHEAMHQIIRSGNMEKNLFSHYLSCMWEQRIVSIYQCIHALEKNFNKSDLNWTAERLAKLLPGYEGLGDRGFAGTSVSYPNCNAMKTPYFLDGRDQFTRAEIFETRDMCQARYGSEAVNSRTNCCTYFSSRFSHLDLLSAICIS